MLFLEARREASEKCLGGVGGHWHLGGVAGRRPPPLPLHLATEQALCAAGPWRGARTSAAPSCEEDASSLRDSGRCWAGVALGSCPGQAEAAAVRLAGVRRPRCSQGCLLLSTFPHTLPWLRTRPPGAFYSLLLLQTQRVPPLCQASFPHCPPGAHLIRIQPPRSLSRSLGAPGGGATSAWLTQDQKCGGPASPTVGAQ